MTLHGCQPSTASQLSSTSESCPLSPPSLALQVRGLTVAMFMLTAADGQPTVSKKYFGLLQVSGSWGCLAAGGRVCVLRVLVDWVCCQRALLRCMPRDDVAASRLALETRWFLPFVLLKVRWFQHCSVDEAWGGLLRVRVRGASTFSPQPNLVEARRVDAQFLLTDIPGAPDFMHAHFRPRAGYAVPEHLMEGVELRRGPRGAPACPELPPLLLAG